jgi:tight adherence protein C
MVILLLFGLAFIGCAVTFAARTIVLGGLRRHETLSQIASYGFRGAVPVAEADAPTRSLRALVDGLARMSGRVAASRAGAERLREVRALLRSAGVYRLDAETFLGYRVLAGGVLPVALLLLSIGSGNLGARTFVLVGFVAAWGWVLPSFFLKRKAARRLQEIDLEMPELVDLLVTTVEAGVGFTAALQLVARRVEGALAQELRICLQEQGLGLTIESALENLVGRVDSLSVRVFVQAIVQGQNLGVSIGKILRDLAIDMRKRRRQMAEERAQKAPTKILFPLVFLILPALFIIVLGGPMIGLGKTLGSLA